MTDMTAGTGQTAEMLTTADGRPLKESLQKALRQQRNQAFMLTLPLLVFIMIFFIVPIIMMLVRSVDNSVVQQVMPRTVAIIGEWDSKSEPPEALFKAAFEDIREAEKIKSHGKVAARLNYQASGMRGLFMGSARKIKKAEPGEIESYRDFMIKANKKWGKLEVWQLLQLESGSMTSSYYAAAIDARTTVDGLKFQPEDRRIYGPLFVRTFVLSLVITVLCIVLGYPIGFMLANLPLRTSNLLMILVLLPFWTSLLVRTSAWIAILQSQGVLNDLMVWIGVIADDGRIQMIYNRTGTIVAMTHILLPFMILPLYSVMRTIPPSFVRAARSLGANPWTAFWKVYFPQTLPGIGAGAILVFILCIGFYITPALVGGQDGILISNQIAYHMQKSLNWGLAGALGTILLVSVLILYWAYNKAVGIENMKLG